MCCRCLAAAVTCLQAPTPFLMGLHSGEPVDQRTLDMLVVADLDRGTLTLAKDDGLLRRCLNHPYMQRLERRVRCADRQRRQRCVNGLGVFLYASTSRSCLDDGRLCAGSLNRY